MNGHAAQDELPLDITTEWLEADGLGGFASGTSSGLRTRRYHALLLAAARPPADRFVLVNGFVAWLETEDGRRELVPQHYAPGITTHTDARVTRFDSEPWPSWRYQTSDGLVLRQELTVLRDSPVTLVSFELETPRSNVRLCLRPLLSGRDFHHLHHENPAFQFDATLAGPLQLFRPYRDVPRIASWSNGSYRHEPVWYRNFHYIEEQRRGLDCEEDLGAPGVLCFDLSRAEAIWLLAAETPGAPRFDCETLGELGRSLKERERGRRAAYRTPLERATEAYLVRRGDGSTIIAGYPWFSDWGRDTFIALRGLCLATGRIGEARDILLAWSGAVSEGMLPNRFPDRSDAPLDYNSVDASLWYVVVARELLDHPRAGAALSGADRERLLSAMRAIVEGYRRGTRFGIRVDTDGLLFAGEPGTQLTWMDAKVADYVVTPRSGKPVEVQALWLNALAALSDDPELAQRFELGRASFQARFWDESAGGLYDVIDVAGEHGIIDDSLRPNQIFAAGGLPTTLLAPHLARKVVDTVEARLWTPLGLRSLAPEHPEFKPHYAGGVWERDTAYHQGTVWPWLAGPFVDAWLKVRGDTTQARRAAHERFIVPLRAHLKRAGIGHVSEIADACSPHEPRGCPFQAWSVSELIRLESRLAPTETP